MPLVYQALNGADTYSFWNYWNTVKDSIYKIYALGGKYSTLQSRAADLRARAKSVDATLETQIAQQSSVIANSQSIWDSVRSMIDQYLSYWQSADASSTTIDHPISTYEGGTVQGLGLIPLLIIGGAGLAAIAYVATTGMQLLSDYETQKGILDALEKKLITTEQAVSLTKAGTARTTFGTELGGQMGKYVGLGIIALGAIYLLPMLLKSKRAATA